MLSRQLHLVSGDKLIHLQWTRKGKTATKGGEAGQIPNRCALTVPSKKCTLTTCNKKRLKKTRRPSHSLPTHTCPACLPACLPALLPAAACPAYMQCLQAHLAGCLLVHQVHLHSSAGCGCSCPFLRLLPLLPRLPTPCRAAVTARGLCWWPW